MIKYRHNFIIEKVQKNISEELEKNKGYKLSSKYFEIILEKTINNVESEPIEQIKTPLEFTVSIPEDCRGQNYDYKVIRTHGDDGNETTTLPTTPDKTQWNLKFSTDKFSTFAIAYSDNSTPVNPYPDPKPDPGKTPGSGSNTPSGSPSVPGGNPGSGTPSKTVTGVKISGDKNITLNTGSSKKLTVTLEPSGAQGTVKWSSSNSTVVKVDQNGNLIALAPGTAVITAECNGHKATVTVKVSAKVTPSNPQPSPQPQPQPSPSPETTPTQTIKVYRLYLPANNEHLYTTDGYEAQVLTAAGWTDEGVGWTSPTSGEGVYRLYSPVTNEHHYTSDVNEVNTLKNNGAWTVDNNEKPLFYSGGSTPIYRLYHEGTRRHHLTKDQHEYDVLRTSGWNDEGIALHSIS